MGAAYDVLVDRFGGNTLTVGNLVDAFLYPTGAAANSPRTWQLSQSQFQTIASGLGFQGAFPWYDGFGASAPDGQVTPNNLVSLARAFATPNGMISHDAYHQIAQVPPTMTGGTGGTGGTGACPHMPGTGTGGTGGTGGHDHGATGGAGHSHYTPYGFSGNPAYANYGMTPYATSNFVPYGSPYATSSYVPQGFGGAGAANYAGGPGMGFSPYQGQVSAGFVPGGWAGPGISTMGAPFVANYPAGGSHSHGDMGGTSMGGMPMGGMGMGMGMPMGGTPGQMGGFMSNGWGLFMGGWGQPPMGGMPGGGHGHGPSTNWGSGPSPWGQGGWGGWNASANPGQVNQALRTLAGADGQISAGDLVDFVSRFDVGGGPTGRPDNALSGREFGQASRTLGLSPWDFLNLDGASGRQRDGKVDFDEMIASLFQADRNGDGLLNTQEARGWADGIRRGGQGDYLDDWTGGYGYGWVAPGIPMPMWGAGGAPIMPTPYPGMGWGWTDTGWGPTPGNGGTGGGMPGGGTGGGMTGGDGHAHSHYTPAYGPTDGYTLGYDPYSYMPGRITYN